jgi:hypothetical protein
LPASRHANLDLNHDEKEKIKMNVQNPNPTPTPSTPPPAPTDWRAQRRAERAARWGAHPMRRHNWLWGVILILLGVIFLLQNLGFPFLTN